MKVNGNINCDGESGLNSLAGGGSGGSLILEIGTLLGYGLISCNGGNGGQYDNNGIGKGGGGGGGRIIIELTDRSYNNEVYNNFSGIVSTYGGTGFQIASSGTIFIQKNIDNKIHNILIIKNNNQTFLPTVITKSYKNDINELNILGYSYVTINLLSNNSYHNNGKYFYLNKIIGDATGEFYIFNCF